MKTVNNCEIKKPVHCYLISQMNIITILFTTSTLILLIQGCALMYFPNMQNVPLLKDKHELKSTIGISNYQVAYSITQHIGIMLNGQYEKTI